MAPTENDVAELTQEDAAPKKRVITDDSYAVVPVHIPDVAVRQLIHKRKIETSMSPSQHLALLLIDYLEKGDDSFVASNRISSEDATKFRTSILTKKRQPGRTSKVAQLEAALEAAAVERAALLAKLEELGVKLG